MNQVLHIFAKDTRRLWLEISISLALTAALVWAFPHRWSSSMYSQYHAVSYSPYGFVTDAGIGSYVLVLLIPLSWWLLISPVIHEENLIGDRQYWLTRPIERGGLAAAKALFIAVFVFAPLLAAQCALLGRAGLPILGSVPGLLYNLVLIVSFLVLPLAALATVTRNFFRMVLVVLGYVLCVGVIFFIAQLASSGTFSTPLGDWICIGLALCGFVAAAAVQYALRRTGIAWSILGATVLLVCAVIGINPDKHLLERAFPAAPPDPGVTLSLSAGQEFLASAMPSAKGSQVFIVLPLHVAGIPLGTVYQPRSVRVTLSDSHGASWKSDWLPAYTEMFLPGERTVRGGFPMPAAVYNRFRGAPVRAQFEFALSFARQARVERISLPLADFRVPGFGLCHPVTGFAYKPDEIEELVCRTALREPQLTLIQSDYSFDPCDHAGPSAAQKFPALAWMGSVERAPAAFGIASVRVGASNFDFRGGQGRGKEPSHFCPGTAVTFTTFADAGRFRTSFEIPSLTLPDFDKRYVVSGGSE